MQQLEEEREENRKREERQRQEHKEEIGRQRQEHKEEIERQRQEHKEEKEKMDKLCSGFLGRQQINGSKLTHQTEFN
jgi:hypothetical protein